MYGTLLKTFIIVTIASALTAGVVRAADFTRFFSGMRASAVSGVENGQCPSGMVRISGTDICIDQYEVSAGKGCPFPTPRSLEETVANRATEGCRAQSVADAAPWTFISQTAAMEICAKEGKRLPSGQEWHMAALGAPVDDTAASCVVENGSLSRTGSARCLSASGAVDMIGNVWEWTTEIATMGAVHGVTLPPSGFVVSADTSGVPLATDVKSGSQAYGNDKAWIDPSIVGGVMRGGYYNSGEAAGIYSFYASSPPSFAGDAVGFRCVR